MTGTRPLGQLAPLAPLRSALKNNVEAASGLEERLRDALAREQEFRCGTILEVYRELAAQAEDERFRCSGIDHRNVKSIAEHASRIKLGVMLASLAVVAHTRMR